MYTITATKTLDKTAQCRKTRNYINIKSNKFTLKYPI